MKILLHYRASPGFRQRLNQRATAAGLSAVVVDEQDEAAFVREAASAEVSDVLSLHVPSTPESRGMIGPAALERMKPGAVLINTARGDLVDQAALVEALRSGRLRAAELDVFAEEPLASDAPLLQLSNVVLAPHLAWLTPETPDRSIDVAIESCLRVRDGHPLLNEIVRCPIVLAS